MNNQFLSVINALGEVLEKNETTILCQQYEIKQLKETIKELSEKSTQKDFSLYNDWKEEIYEKK